MASDDARKLNELTAAADEAMALAAQFRKEADDASDDEKDALFTKAEKALADAQEKRKQAASLTEEIQNSMSMREQRFDSALDDYRNEQAAKRKAVSDTINALRGNPVTPDDAAHAAHLNADYKPENWDDSAPAMSQHADVLNAAGDNLKALAKEQTLAWRRVVQRHKLDARAIQNDLEPRMFEMLHANVSGNYDTFWVPDEVRSEVTIHPGDAPTMLIDMVGRLSVGNAKGQHSRHRPRRLGRLPGRVGGRRAGGHAG